MGTEFKLGHAISRFAACAMVLASLAACGGGDGASTPVVNGSGSQSPISTAPVGINYTSQLAVAGAAAAVGLFNKQGADGYAYVGSYAFNTGTGATPSYAVEELFVKGQANTTYQYKAVSEPTPATDWLAMLNTEGANGYLYKGSQYFSGNSVSVPTGPTNALFVKSSARNTTYSYRQIAGASTLSALNANGADGFASRGEYAHGSAIYSVYVKDNSSSATFSYVTKPDNSTAPALLADMNTMGSQMYVYTGTYALGGSIVAIYEKNSASTVATEYTNAPLSLTKSNQQLVSKANQFAATGYFYFGDLAVSTNLFSFFYKGAAVTNPISGPVFP